MPEIAYSLKNVGWVEEANPRGVRNRVINVNLCYQTKTVIETRFLVPGEKKPGGVRNRVS
jgi:hypothetical protein